MEKNLNVFVVACKEYNKESNSIIGIYNKVEIESNRMDLCVLTGINYVKSSDAKSGFVLDYYLKCLEDKDGSGQEGKKIPLYALSGSLRSESQGVEYTANTAIFSEEKNISIPCSGIYELQVFLVEESMIKENDAKERYKTYQDEKQLPQAAFRFEIVKEIVA